MKGYRFYEEFGSPSNKRKGISQGNCIALCIDSPYQISPRYNREGKQETYSHQEAFAALYTDPNSDLMYGSVAHDYLSKNCKRVSENKAREIHPKLFERIDR